MKKIFLTLLFLIFGVSLSACNLSIGNSSNLTTSENQTTKSNTTTSAKEKAYFEYLNRGLVVTRSGNNAVLSWRYLSTDLKGTTFNIIRTCDGESKVVNSEPLTGATYYQDPIDKTKEYPYQIESINAEGTTLSEEYTLNANTKQGPWTTVPIKSGLKINNVWVGDLNGDGTYDYVLDRVANQASTTDDEEASDDEDTKQSIEAYLSDGTFLWSIDLGDNSKKKYRIEPGSTTISVGHWDGVNVYDLDNDGKAEVFFRIANGVTFGNGEKFTYSDDTHQWIARVDGMTGKLIDKAEVPDDFIDDGPMGAQMGVGFLDGKKPSLVCVMKNRRNDKGDDLGFNLQIMAYSITNNTFKLDWQWKAVDDNLDCGTQIDGHHFRICDVDLDGKQEICELTFCLNGDGTLRYEMYHSDGIKHGDRFYVGIMNKGDTTMTGYGIQQYNKDLIGEYAYNASTGEVYWKHYLSESGDVGRGCAADIDPNKDGWESWAFSGIYNVKENSLMSEEGQTLWPDINMQWDGDLLFESSHLNVIDEWNYQEQRTSRVCSLYSLYNLYNKQIGHYPSVDNSGKYPLFVGDIEGDWRDEVIMVDYYNNNLVIFTTQTSTEYRIPSLLSDMTYRSWLTVKGYKQGWTAGIYFGSDMDISKTFPNV